MLATLLLSAVLTTAAVQPPQPAVWRHSWDNVAGMMYSHGGNASAINPTATAYLAEHYALVSFSSCYGGSNYLQGGPSHEEAALTTAQELRNTNPDIKNVFYWKVDDALELEHCSSGSKIWAAHPEWQLKDDSGKVIMHGAPVMDARQPAFRDFWVEHLVNLSKVLDPKTGKPLIDMIYCDGMDGTMPPTPLTGLTPAESDAYHQGTFTMIHQLQTELAAAGYGQLAMINGLDTVPGVARHAGIAASSMVDHFDILQFVNRTTGQWITEAPSGNPTATTMQDLLFKVIRSPLNVNRTMCIKGWVGPTVKQDGMWPNNTVFPGGTGTGGTSGAPTTAAGKQAAAALWFNQALATFLLVADDNTWFSYSWFWGIGDYVPFNGTKSAGHTCPDNFYPEMQCKLGPPEGPPATSATHPLLYTRQFQHASVTVDLGDRGATKVVWAATAACPAEVYMLQAHRDALTAAARLL